MSGKSNPPKTKTNKAELKNEEIKVLVLRGGPSAEREVSLESGAAVAAALRTAGFVVAEADINPDNLSALEQNDFDVIVPMLHGTFGEDGQLQKILEQRNLCYAGSDSVASELAMDKYRSKLAFQQAGLLTPYSQLIEVACEKILGSAEFECYIESCIEQVGTTCVVKPNCQGSSVGITIAGSSKIAKKAIQQVVAEHGDCLVERFVKGRELTVGVIGDQPLPVLEIRAAQGFYDYQAKYHDDKTQYYFDIELSEDTLIAIQQAGLAAFKALNCRDFGRVDFIVDERNQIFVLEVNNLPGFTSHSLVPKAAAQAGNDMPKICAQIVRMALQRSI
ncbi:MAG: D-alanine--D-alanine ligase [Sedimentisphaerales bacterium]|nr:D-alanine--D-alanine ligase [Sedimentisphaerales bacterium]